MPLTAKGEKILAAMQEKHGDEEGKRIFYASKKAGTISGVDAWSEEARKASAEARHHGIEGKLPKAAGQKSVFDLPGGESVTVEKQGSGYYASTDKYDFEAPNATAMAAKLKRMGATHVGFDSADSHRRRRGKSYDPRGRETGSWEEEDGMRRKKDSMPLFVMLDRTSAPLTYDAVGGIDCVMDDGARMEITSDGWLKAMPRIARTGIQLYKGDECGRPELDSVRVFRPEASVFSDSAIHSYTHLPITIEHPGGAVDAGNWKKHAVGETGDEVLRDGGTVRVPMMLRDAAAIQLVKDGKRQLSVGYGCELDWTSGVTSDGEAYDAVQRNIRGNHLAIVSQARGGPSLRIGDADMTDLKTVMIDGVPCQMSDRDAAVVQRALSELQDQLEDQSENFKKFKKAKEEKEEKDAATIAAKDTEVATRDGKIVALEQQVKDAQLTPEKLDALVDGRMAIRAHATALLPAFKCDGKSDADIRRAVVASKIGDERAKAMSDENVVGAFQAFVPGGPNPIADARAAFAGPGPGPAFSGPMSLQDGRAAKQAAFNEMVKDMENAWRPKA